MNAPPDPYEQHIVRSWQANAAPWIQAIDHGRIASRRLVTDQAVIDALTSLQPRRVLDLGCGEGWLARALNRAGVAALGLDAIPALIAQARRQIDPAAPAASEFRVLDYRHFAECSAELAAQSCDTAVCNFSLLGAESVATLIASLPQVLGSRGRLVIQTLHPLAACGMRPYTDGWREGSWSGFDAGFSDPAPWYFRTLQSWVLLLRRCGFDLLECREPSVPGATSPSSMLFICEVRQP